MQLIKSAWAGKTCSYVVLGSRKNTVTSWILFLSGTFLAASTYKHSWIYTLDKLGFNNYLLVNCLLTLSTLHTTICDLSSEKNGKWSKEHKLCQGCRCSRPVFSYTCTRCLLFANVLNQDTKMLAACKHENPHLRSFRQDVQLKCLNTLSLLDGETCIREGWLTAVWLLVLKELECFFGSYEALRDCCLLPLQYL